MSLEVWIVDVRKQVLFLRGICRGYHDMYIFIAFIRESLPHSNSRRCVIVDERDNIHNSPGTACLIIDAIKVVVMLTFNPNRKAVSPINLITPLA